MKMLLLDCETSSLDVATGHLLEVACIVWDVRFASIVKAYSSLVRGPSNEAAAINRIPVGLAVSDDASPRDAVMRAIVHMAKGCDAIVAHGDFDHAWLPELHGWSWIDSCADIEWAQTGSSRALTSLLVAHDIPIGRAHRAMSDCDMIARLLEWHAAHGHDVPAMLTRALRPKVLVVADTPKPWEMKDGEWAALKDQLSAAGFRFNDVTKWSRRMPREDVASLPFPTHEVA